MATGWGKVVQNRMWIFPPSPLPLDQYCPSSTVRQTAFLARLFVNTLDSSTCSYSRKTRLSEMLLFMPWPRADVTTLENSSRFTSQVPPEPRDLQAKICTTTEMFYCHASSQLMHTGGASRGVFVCSHTVPIDHPLRYAVVTHDSRIPAVESVPLNHFINASDHREVVC